MGRVELPCLIRHDVLSVACLPFHHMVIISSPCGNRTRLASVRGWHPKPIDERAISFQCAGQELNLHSLRRVIYDHLGSPMPSRRMLFQWRRRESNPQSRRFELGRFADLRTTPFSKRPRWDLNPRTHKRLFAATCFQDRVLIQPVGFHRSRAAEAGIEPA